MQKRFAVGLFTIGVLFMLVSSPVAQGTIIRVTQLFLNGNRLTAASGTAVVTIPNTTQTLLGTTTICTTANWCQSTTTLLDAQVQTLPTLPVTLVAAPGAGYWIHVIAATLSTNTSAGAYTNVNATYSDLHLALDTITVSGALMNLSAVGYADMTNVIGGATRAVYPFPMPYLQTLDAGGMAGDWEPVSSAPQTATLVENKALTIAADNNSAGNYGGGNVANRVLVSVTYSKEAVQP